MIIDTKHDLLKNSLREQKLSQNSMKTNIDQSSVAGAEQKSLALDMQNESAELAEAMEKKKKKEKEKKKIVEEKAREESVKIERNPLALLRLF